MDILRHGDSLGRTGFSNCIYIRSERPSKRVVAFGGERRVAYRAGVPSPSGESVVWLTVPRNLLSSRNDAKNAELDMYVQAHALHRFDERMRGLDDQLGLGRSLNFSLRDAVVCRHNGDEGLIEFTHDGKRLGYFAFTCTETMLVVRTFLFLTNSGTPEGVKLDDLLGTRKIDKNYLGIDSIFAFLHTDLLSSPWLCDALVEAGCEQLCDLASDFRAKKQASGYALDATRYLGLPETVLAEAT
jgi:hypothetical protein